MNQPRHEEINFKIERKVLQIEDLEMYRKNKDIIKGCEGWFKYGRNKVLKYNYKHLFQSSINLMPFIKWIRMYKWKKYLKYDLISGFTIGVMLIPQGLAYARLTNLPPVTGLYVSTIIPLIYMLTGSSKSLSFGAFSIISLMIGSVISSDLPSDYLSRHQVVNSDPGLFHMDLVDAQLYVSAALTFYIGVIQIVLSIFSFGFISNLFSSTITNAFVFGSACQVATTQAPYLFGVSINKSSTQGISPLIKTYIAIFTNITTANICEIVISISAIIFLLVFRYLNVYSEKKCNFPIPAELLIIIISTGISYAAKFDERFNVRVIGLIPSGLPRPIIPAFELFTDLILPSFTIAITSYAITVSLAKGLATKSDDKISYNGELFAYGICNTFGSFFRCFASGGSLSRSAILTKLGRTQLSAILSSFIIMMVLLVASSLFYYLPLSVLSAIIVVALISVFQQSVALKTIWIFSKFQTFIWILTVVSIVFLDVQYGLLIGVGVNMLEVIYSLCVPKYTTLGEFGSTRIYNDTKIFETQSISKNIIIIQFGHSLVYLNSERFLSQTLDLIDKMISQRSGADIRGIIIIDAKYIMKCDIEGGESIRKVIAVSYKNKIDIYLANASDDLNKFVKKYLIHYNSFILIFPTVTDAVYFAQEEEKGFLDHMLSKQHSLANLRL